MPESYTGQYLADMVEPAVTVRRARKKPDPVAA